MLPRSSSHSSSLASASRPHHAKSISLSASSSLPLRARLSARSRLTNLGVLLLSFSLAFSLLLHLRALLRSGAVPLFRGIPPPGFGSWSSFHGLTPANLALNVPKPAEGAEKLDHLVVVVGHAVWAGTSFAERENDASWVLENWQRGGSVKTFWKHIAKGVEIADADPTALLVFSGGATRATALQTEAESYFALAAASGMKLPVLPGYDYSHAAAGAVVAPKTSGKGSKGKGAIVADAADILGVGVVGQQAASNAGVATTAAGLHGVRMTTENYALDSFENLLFSVARFREYTGRYPLRISVVGYGMKKSRFEELHAKALRWPVKAFVRGQKRFHYIGIDDEGDVKLEYEGEKLKTFPMFERDMYGCHGLLLEKRRHRNPTRRFHPYFTSAPEMADLLNWCPPDGSGLQGIFRNSLPWDLRVTTDGWGRGAKAYREAHRGEALLPDTRWLEVGREKD